MDLLGLFINQNEIGGSLATEAVVGLTSTLANAAMSKVEIPIFDKIINEYRRANEEGLKELERIQQEI